MNNKPNHICFNLSVRRAGNATIGAFKKHYEYTNAREIVSESMDEGLFVWFGNSHTFVFEGLERHLYIL